MQSETLLSLIGKIRVQRIRLAQHPKHSLTCTWTTDDELKFYELLELYGADLALIQAYFPSHSRKQIRRKYQEMQQRFLRRLEHSENRRLEQRRKSYFDQAVLYSNMIKWPKKPNTAESFSSEESP